MPILETRHLRPARPLSFLAACLAIPLALGQEVARYDAKTFYETTTLRGASFAPGGGSILYTSDQSGVFNVYSIPVAGGEPKQLTTSTTNAVMSIGYFPNDERFLYTADEGGNELNHVYLQHPSGVAVDLTPGEELKASFAGWRGDDAAFFVLTNERDPRFFDLYRYDVADLEAGTTAEAYPRTLVYESDEELQVSGVSLDGRWVALEKIRNNVDSDVYVWDAENPDGEAVHVTPHEGDATHSVVTFTPDSKRLCYSTNAEGEFSRVLAYDLESGERATVAAADWDVAGVSFSRDGRYRVTTVNADARTQVTVLDRRTQKPVELPDVPRGDVTGIRFSRGGEHIAFYVNGDTQPSNLYVANLAEGEHRKLTRAGNPKIDPANLVESEVIRFASYDGVEIPCLLYKPHGASAESRVPALLWIHGGPGGQSRTGYRAEIQHLVNHGFAILAVNNRGSSGYGKTFFHLDDRKHGDADLKDCVAARSYLEGLDWIDGDSVGIMGGSYGGYMVAAALAFEPDVFDVGIDIFGVTNWLRTLESIPPWWEGFREALYAEMGDPEVDRERLAARSPLLHADNITKPLFVVQGANDPRVLQAESDELVEKVRANGVPVQYVLFEDEGHGFRKRENRIEASEAWLKFANEYLRDRPD